MREDMARVVIERPRYRSSGRYHEVRPHGIAHRDLERLADLPSVEGMRRPHTYRKNMSDLLGPLHRFLVRQVGRPWDEVYSEICDRISPNSTVQLHILGHLHDLIETEVIIDADGRLQMPGQWRPGYIDDWPGQLFVHPNTGIIRRVPEARLPWNRRQLTAEPELKTVSEERELWRRDGIWYWAIFATAPAVPAETPAPVDLFTGQQVAAGTRYRAAKRQASRRDLRRHGLTNESANG